MLLVLKDRKRIEFAEKLIEQQKGVVRYWRDQWDVDRENKVGIDTSKNYKMYTMQLAKLNAYRDMRNIFIGTLEEMDWVTKNIEA